MYLDNLRIFRANFLLARTNKIRAEEVKNLELIKVLKKTLILLNQLSRYFN